MHPLLLIVGTGLIVFVGFSLRGAKDPYGYSTNRFWPALFYAVLAACLVGLGFALLFAGTAVHHGYKRSELTSEELRTEWREIRSVQIFDFRRETETIGSIQGNGRNAHGHIETNQFYSFYKRRGNDAYDRDRIPQEKAQIYEYDSGTALLIERKLVYANSSNEIDRFAPPLGDKRSYIVYLPRGTIK